MPRCSKASTLPCKCARCIEVRAKNHLYCIHCDKSGPLSDFCPTCHACPACTREHHLDCQHCGRRVCTYDFCYNCLNCKKHDQCIDCSRCHKKARVGFGGLGCKKCKICSRCGLCKCQIESIYRKTQLARKEYERRASVADIILMDGTAVNRARVPFHQSSKLEFKKNPLKRFLSVEIEVAGLDPKRNANPLTLNLTTLEINEAVCKWRGRLVEDVSLPSTGFEINTAPANGDKFIHQIDEICAALQKFGATTENKTDQRKRIACCGLHVHVDARDFGYMDLKKFLMIYEMIEDDLYRMLPGYRRASHFCQRCGKKYGMMVRANKPIPPDKKKKSPDPLKASLITAVYGNKAKVPDRSGKRVCTQECRYSAVNLHQYWYRGTIEFRHFYGTVDPKLIKSWAILVGGILEYAIVTSDRQLYDIPPQDLLLTIAAKYGLANFVRDQWDKFRKDTNLKESPLLGDVPHQQQAAEIRFVANDAPAFRVNAAGDIVWGR